MKIKRFKGRSLEKMYEVIHREMGSDAIVIPARSPEGVKAFMPALFGGDQHELIAVVDDRGADSQAVSRFLGAGELDQRLEDMQATTLRHVDQAVKKLAGEMKSLSWAAPSFDNGGARAGQPGGGWDPRFTKLVMGRYPDFFTSRTTERCQEVVKSFFHVADQFQAQRTESPHVVVMVGPTGSGKTTTLAKLAARWSLDQRLKVGIITTDTYRVAAVDQVKEYASLLGLEVQVAFSATEAARAVKAMAGKDIILVDTPGRSHYDQMGLASLRSVMGGLGTATVMLTVPATWNRDSLGDMINNFSLLSPDYTVITKVDEARQMDLLTVVPCETKSPIVFLTDGQRVPQDIHNASVKGIADLLMPAGTRK